MQVRDSQQIRIIVVDDERSVADTLGMIFRLNGFEAVSTYSAEQALRAATELPPDVLLSDISMPDMDGFGCAHAVLRLYPGCEVVLFSGQETEHRKRANELGYGLLRKPMEPETLVKFVRARVADAARGKAAGF